MVVAVTVTVTVAVAVILVANGDVRIDTDDKQGK